MRGTKRLDFIDVAKGIAIFLVVYAHVLHTGFIYQVIFSFHVPLFFFLAGTTYQKKGGFKTFVLGKARRLLLPYYFWGLISIVVFKILGRFIMNGNETTSLLDDLFGLLYANSRNGLMKWNTPLWFLPSLFMVYIVIDLLERFVIIGGGYYRRCILILCFISIGLLFEKYVNCILPFHFEQVIYLVSFAEAGIAVQPYFWKESRNERTEKHIKRILVIFTGLLLCSIISYFNGLAEIRTYDYGRSGVLFLLSSILGIISTIELSVLLHDSIILQRLGMKTMAVLVMHKFPILLFQLIIPFSKNILSNGKSLGAILLSFPIAIVCIILCYVGDLIIVRICPCLLGADNQYKQHLS